MLSPVFDWDGDISPRTLLRFTGFTKVVRVLLGICKTKPRMFKCNNVFVCFMLFALYYSSGYY